MKVNIIIRAFNRLEYTVLTVRSIDELAGFDDYKMIIIDQASTDGTGQWLKSIEKEGYYKIKPIYLTENLGDFGGTKVGYDNLDEDCEYTFQWDNDCMALTPNFLKKAVEIMDNFKDIGQLMFKREGVGGVIQLLNRFEYNGVIFGDAPVATCVNIQRRKAVEEINQWVVDESIFWDFNLNDQMRKKGYRVMKCENIKVNHMDIFPELKLNLQAKKYPIYFSNRQDGKGKVNYNLTKY